MSIIKQPPRLTNRETIIKFIEADLWTWLKDMSVAFLKINFADNFQAFTVANISIPAGTEVAIPNQFKNRYPGVIPVGRIVVRQIGDANIIDGATPWTENLLFLQNPSANDAVISVLFYK